MCARVCKYIKEKKLNLKFYWKQFKPEEEEPSGGTRFERRNPVRKSVKNKREGTEMKATRLAK